MSKKLLFALWGGLFILCAGLGFIPEPEGLLRAALTGLSILFFLPPAMLLHVAKPEKDTDTIKLLRNLSALSLLVTPVVLIVNFLTAFGSETLGTVLHYTLIIVSSPMVCSGYWVLSLFLWACLLMASMKALRK